MPIMPLHGDYAMPVMQLHGEDLNISHYFNSSIYLPTIFLAII